MKQLFILCITTIMLGACSGPDSKVIVENKHELELSIARGIQIPFNTYDTVILEESKAIYTAGETPKERIYDDDYLPNLDSTIYFNEFKKRISKPVIVWNDELSKIITKRVYYDKIEGIDSARNAEVMRRYQKVYENMVFVTLGGRVVSKDTVKITESFLNKGSEIFISKVFFLDHGKWSSSTTDTLKYIK